MHDPVTLLTVISVLMFGAALFSADAQSIAAPIALVTTAETLAAVGFALSLPSGNGKSVVKCFAQVTGGTNTTALVLKIYRGSTTAGTLLQTSTLNMVAVAGITNFMLTAVFLDVLQLATQAQYCFSITQTAATANGNIVSATIETELLSG